MRNLASSIVCLTLAATLLACALPPESARGAAMPTPELAGTLASALARTATPRPRTATPGPTATRTATVTAPTTAPSPTLTATPGSRLPTLLAEVSFAAAGGDAYPFTTYGLTRPALDGAGHAVLLCRYHEPGRPNQAALTTIDLRQGTRGPVVPLPIDSAEHIAVSQGRAYVEHWRSGESYLHLSAIELETGHVVADAPLEGYLASVLECLLADPAGQLYLPMASGLEVRSGTSLAVVRRLPWPADASDDCGWPAVWLAMDPAGERLYVATCKQLHAYRTADLSLVWEVPRPSLPLLSFVVDAAGRSLYAWYGVSASSPEKSRLVAYDAESGRVLQDLEFPTHPQATDLRMPDGSGWELRWADSAQGSLLFLGIQDSGRPDRMLWKMGADGRPLLPEPVVTGDGLDYAVGDGRVLAVSSGRHQASLLDLADLHPVARLTLGVEIRGVLADPDRGRLYVNDSTGFLHVLDARDYHPITSFEVGSGPMTLDAANGLLFVARAPEGLEVAVVDTASLAVAGVISGGDSVAVDPAGRRAFVGSEGGAGIQVWDTRTFTHLASIAWTGRPVYNPLRDELYLERPGALYPAATIVDGKSLAVTGQVRFDPPAVRTDDAYYPGLQATDLTLDLQHEVLTADLAFRDKSGAISEWQAISARTLEPSPHTVTLLRQPGGGGLVALPPEDGLVYTRSCEQFPAARQDCRTIVYRAGTDEVIAEHTDLILDLCLPGTGVGLMPGKGTWQAFDLETWAPLGSFPDPGIRKLDPASRRLYAWQGSTLTVLGYGGD